MTGMKLCASCGIEKPLDAFNKNSRNKDGLSNSCRECDNAYLRRWRKNNPAKSSAYSRKYYYSHIDEAREYHKRYYAEHREECLARSKAWAKENSEILSSYRKHYNENYKHRRKILKYKRELTA